jgi:hypothetical protein
MVEKGHQHELCDNVFGSERATASAGAAAAADVCDLC